MPVAVVILAALSSSFSDRELRRSGRAVGCECHFDACLNIADDSHESHLGAVPAVVGTTSSGFIAFFKRSAPRNSSGRRFLVTTMLAPFAVSMQLPPPTARSKSQFFSWKIAAT